ncbi:hypothetical protein AOLI_G00167150 [Acnodon oligacanthus]
MYYLQADLNIDQPPTSKLPLRLVQSRMYLRRELQKVEAALGPYSAWSLVVKKGVTVERTVVTEQVSEVGRGGIVESFVSQEENSGFSGGQE